jgi:hypothetical protein
MLVRLRVVTLWCGFKDDRPRSEDLEQATFPPPDERCKGGCRRTRSDGQM